MSATAPKAIDLFAGAGGMSCGLRAAGFDVAGGVESDPTAHATYLHNHPRKFTLDRAVDIRALEAKDIWLATGIAKGELDLVAGGPPCQGFSTAGYRRVGDQRSALVWDFIRLVGALRPRYFVMENVVGLISMKNARGQLVIEALAEAFDQIGYAHSIPSDRANRSDLIVNAANFGVPQRRRRVLIFGALGTRTPLPSLTPPPIDRVATVSDALGDLPEPTPTGAVDLDSIAHLSGYAQMVRAGGIQTTNHVSTRHKPWMVTRMREQPQGQPLYDTWAHAWVRLESDSPSPTVKENHNAPFVHPTRPRVISPRECARLQSFPDHFHFIGPKSRQLVQIGNAVPPVLAYYVGQSVLSALTLEGWRYDAACTRGERPVFRDHTRAGIAAGSASGLSRGIRKSSGT